MLKDYLAGELSVRLARLEEIARGDCASRVSRLRREAETGGVSALGPVVLRTLELLDGLCWNALDRGDIGDFDRQMQVAADLHEFAVCARLLDGS